MEGKSLFDDPDRNHWWEFSEPLSTARMIAFLGPPPKNLLRRSGRLDDFFEDEEFRWPDLVPRDCALDSIFTRLEGKEKEKFVAFVRRMLTWEPGGRATAKQLLADLWLERGS